MYGAAEKKRISYIENAIVSAAQTADSTRFSLVRDIGGKELLPAVGGRFAPAFAEVLGQAPLRDNPYAVPVSRFGALPLEYKEYVDHSRPLRDGELRIKRAACLLGTSDLSLYTGTSGVVFACTENELGGVSCGVEEWIDVGADHAAVAHIPWCKDVGSRLTDIDGFLIDL